jgi:hypothetical protein
VSVQGLIDDGVHCCGRCDAFGRHDYCGQCGARFFGEGRTWRECTKCKIEVCATFCPMCGGELDCEELQRWERGDVDLEAEGASAAAQIEKLLAGNLPLERALYEDDTEGMRSAQAQGGLAGMINAGFNR